ncbi:MAG: hypothetical protein EOP06_18060 [Proteobacteria bacterium]|nr:MAG: hypothetical protein EOP06_18060 [Pseudomonadota bacterium]
MKESVGGLMAWLLSAFLVFVEKLILLYFVLRGALAAYMAGDWPILIFTALITGWFIFTPVVFGEPRYFLSGTLVWLLIATYRFWQSTSRHAAAEVAEPKRVS